MLVNSPLLEEYHVHLPPADNCELSKMNTSSSPNWPNKLLIPSATRLQVPSCPILPIIQHNLHNSRLATGTRPITSPIQNKGVYLREPEKCWTWKVMETLEVAFWAPTFSSQHSIMNLADPLPKLPVTQSSHTCSATPNPSALHSNSQFSKIYPSKNYYVLSVGWNIEGFALFPMTMC